MDAALGGGELGIKITNENAEGAKFLHITLAGILPRLGLSMVYWLSQIQVSSLHRVT